MNDRADTGAETILPFPKRSAAATSASTNQTGKEPLVLTTAKTFPVIEIFGPTVQGEGSLVGTPCHFVRFGGCDYRCSWCDTPHAVLPEEVRANAQPMSAGMIFTQLSQLEAQVPWIIISGGNPALLQLGELVERLHQAGWKVAVETQGSVFKPWLRDVDLLTVSPKPPSSGMATDFNKLSIVLANNKSVDIKVVVFDENDLEYAREVRLRYPQHTMYLSTGTFVGESTRDDILDRMRTFVEKGVRDGSLYGVRYGMQLHVLLWGHKRGV